MDTANSPVDLPELVTNSLWFLVLSVAVFLNVCLFD